MGLLGAKGTIDADIGVQVRKAKTGEIIQQIPYSAVYEMGLLAAIENHGYDPEKTKVDFDKAQLAICPMCGLAWYEPWNSKNKRCPRCGIGEG